MVKKIVVAGSRNYNNYEEAKAFIDACIINIRNENTLVFLSGGCRGADAMGERYARENGFETERFPADWDKYDKWAGPIRNRKMAEEADYIICFWDGHSSGTKSMIRIANDLNKPIRIKKILSEA